MTVGPLVSEAALVTRAADGDEAAFRALWTTAERRAYGLCFRLTGNDADAVDALADTQLAAWRNLGRFEARCPFALWVLAIARNAAVAVVRARARRNETGLDAAAERPDVRNGSADTVVESMAIRDALGAVPENQREALLPWAGGMSHDEIGRLLGAEPGTVKVWVHRARVSLRARLAAGDGGH